MDHDPLPYLQLEITKVTNASSAAPVYEFELGVRSLPLERLDGSWGHMVQPWFWSGVGADRWVKRGPRAPTVAQLATLVNRTGGGLRSPPGFPEMGVEEGDALTVTLRQYHTWTIGNSSRCTVEDVTIYSSKGLNFYELDGEGAHTYRRIHNARRDWQLISSNADAFHSIDVSVGPLLEDSELGYCLDDFFNIHSTIHFLVSAPLASSAAETSGGVNAQVTLVNPRIGVGSNTPSDSGENPHTLDEWYGDTSPITNIKAGKDTILCRTFNTYDETWWLGSGAEEDAGHRPCAHVHCGEDGADIQAESADSRRLHVGRQDRGVGHRAAGRCAFCI